jgi:hypothetical protein
MNRENSYKMFIDQFMKYNGIDNLDGYNPININSYFQNFLETCKTSRAPKCNHSEIFDCNCDPFLWDVTSENIKSYLKTLYFGGRKSTTSPTFVDFASSKRVPIRDD